MPSDKAGFVFLDVTRSHSCAGFTRETPSVIRPAFLPPSSGLQELGGAELLTPLEHRGAGGAAVCGAARGGGADTNVTGTQIMLIVTRS